MTHGDTSIVTQWVKLPPGIMAFHECQFESLLIHFFYIFFSLLLFYFDLYIVDYNAKGQGLQESR